MSKEDAESNARLVKALFAGNSESDSDVDVMSAIFDAAEESLVEKDHETPSHMQLDYDADGNPLQLRFAYVDEVDCIGCMYPRSRH